MMDADEVCGYIFHHAQITANLQLCVSSVHSIILTLKTLDSNSNNDAFVLLINRRFCYVLLCNSLLESLPLFNKG